MTSASEPSVVDPRRLTRIALFGALGFYVAGSLFYIAEHEYEAFRARVVDAAVLRGRTETISQILDSAKKECVPFSVFLGNRLVNLINVDCFRKKAPTPAGGAPRP